MKRMLALLLTLTLALGLLAGCGTHEQLMQSCPAYREIAASQSQRKEA